MTSRRSRRSTYVKLQRLQIIANKGQEGKKIDSHVISGCYNTCDMFDTPNDLSMWKGRGRPQNLVLRKSSKRWETCVLSLHLFGPIFVETSLFTRRWVPTGSSISQCFFLIWYFGYVWMCYNALFGLKLTPTNRHFIKCMVQLSTLRQ